MSGWLGQGLAPTNSRGRPTKRCPGERKLPRPGIAPRRESVRVRRGIAEVVGQGGILIVRALPQPPGGPLHSHLFALRSLLYAFFAFPVPAVNIVAEDRGDGDGRLLGSPGGRKSTGTSWRTAHAATSSSKRARVADRRAVGALLAGVGKIISHLRRPSPSRHRACRNRISTTLPASTWSHTICSSSMAW